MDGRDGEQTGDWIWNCGIRIRNPRETLNVHMSNDHDQVIHSLYHLSYGAAELEMSLKEEPEYRGKYSSQQETRRSARRPDRYFVPVTAFTLMSIPQMAIRCLCGVRFQAVMVCLMDVVGERWRHATQEVFRLMKMLLFVDRVRTWRLRLPMRRCILVDCRRILRPASWRTSFVRLKDLWWAFFCKCNGRCCS